MSPTTFRREPPIDVEVWALDLLVEDDLPIAGSEVAWALFIDLERSGSCNTHTAAQTRGGDALLRAIDWEVDAAIYDWDGVRLHLPIYWQVEARLGAAREKVPLSVRQPFVYPGLTLEDYTVAYRIRIQTVDKVRLGPSQYYRFSGAVLDSLPTTDTPSGSTHRDGGNSALHERGCSAGLNPPASSSDRAM